MVESTRRVGRLLRMAVMPGPQQWVKNDLSDAIFYLRVVVALSIGLFYGVIGAQGLMSFLSFFGIIFLLGQVWLQYQEVDEAAFEDPDKISQSPLSFEGLPQSISLFLLVWIVTFTLAH